MIAAVIKTVLSNVFLLLPLVAIVTTSVKSRRLRIGRRPHNVAYLLWGEMLFYSVGLGFIWSGVFHAYFQQIAAPSIGWQPSPFEYELGWLEIGIAIVALGALWRGYAYRAAVTIPVVVFGFAAAAQHLAQIACCRNYAPGNAGLILWLGDLAIPAIFIILMWLSRLEADRR